MRVKVQQINRKWDVNQWQFTDGDAVQLNDIAQVTLKTSQPLYYDTFEKIQIGKCYLIDETSFNTVALMEP